MDWSQLGCGVKGHVTYAPVERDLAGRLSVTTPEGVAWRCLRCGTFVIGGPSATGPAADAPEVRRGKELRSGLILRLFAVERFIRAVLSGVIAYALWRFTYSEESIEKAFDRELPVIKDLLRQLGFNVNHSKLLGLIQHAFTLTPHTLTLLAYGAAGYALIELIEGIGLWLLKRWGEYFAMIATSVGIPYEIYDLTTKITVLRVLAFVVNVALVVYLVATKRLFGVRGGKRAYEARLRSASVMQAEIDALAAGHASPDHAHPDHAHPDHAHPDHAGLAPAGPAGGAPADNGTAGASPAPAGPAPATPRPAKPGDGA